MSRSFDQNKKNFEEFVVWFDKHIKGYEKGEGQLFFNKLLQAFGNKDLLSAGARCEERVKKRRGTVGFADFLWPKRVVIELKERGTALNKYYEQAFEYWWTLVPNRPKYMALCNFDEFWIYDLNIQINDPVHVLKTKDLVNDYSALAFLFEQEQTPIFNNNNVQVTEGAAKILGSMFFSLSKRRVEQELAQRFVLQIVVALFSEDVGLIPKHTIHKILKSAVSNPITQKELTNLFRAMATEEAAKKPKDYKDIPYFNGGIFNEVDAVELSYEELDLLYEASKEDWSKVRPSIFGSIFEASMDPKERHGHGIHYTSELDIQKIVMPTIVRPFREKIEKASSKEKLAKVLQEIREFKVLDPACGSGNFLYIAFWELRRLEVEVLDLIAEKTKTKQSSMSLVSPKNFYGIDTNSFGLELAKVALCIGRKLSADELKVPDHILPFEDLETNFINEDALLSTWPEADAIIGNPPFLGSRKMRESGFTDQYIKSIWALFPNNDFPKSADYCCYWFRKAHEHAATYVGLVGSNSITQNESRKASLEFILNHGGTIHYAISSQEWSGEAAVHVSIVNWVKNNQSVEKVLDGIVVETINSSLKNEMAVSFADRLAINKNICFQGIVPVGKFIIDESTAKEWIKDKAENKEVIKTLISISDITDCFNFKAGKLIIDFNDMQIEQASTYVKPYKYVLKFVKPQRDKVRRKIHKEKWWQFGDKRPAMRKAVKNLTKYIAMPGHSKWYMPVFIPSDWLVYNSAFAIASDDYYTLGILTSKLHRDWVRAQSSTLKGDTRYTNTTCFETFPFLWDKDNKIKNKIRAVTQDLDTYRLSIMKDRKIGITKLYNDFFHEPESKLFKLHAQLDKLVCEEVYGWPYDPTKNYNAELFELNKLIYEKEQSESKSLKKGTKKPDKLKEAKNVKIKKK